MTRLPRDLSGDELAKSLGAFGYQRTRQKGSHMRLTTVLNGEHHVTIPRHDPLRIGTLGGILDSIATHFGLTREAVLERLFP